MFHSITRVIVMSANRVNRGTGSGRNVGRRRGATAHPAPRGGRTRAFLPRRGLWRAVRRFFSDGARGEQRPSLYPTHGIWRAVDLDRRNSMESVSAGPPQHWHAQHAKSFVCDRHVRNSVKRSTGVRVGPVVSRARCRRRDGTRRCKSRRINEGKQYS